MTGTTSKKQSCRRRWIDGFCGGVARRLGRGPAPTGGRSARVGGRPGQVSEAIGCRRAEARSRREGSPGLVSPPSRRSWRWHRNIYLEYIVWSERLVRGGGVTGLLSRGGLAGGRRYRIMLHVDSTIMAFNRTRHGGLGNVEERALWRQAQGAVAAALVRRGFAAPLCR